MKKMCVLLLFGFISHYAFAQTQMEMNDAEYNKYRKADKELNEVYQKILSEYKEDTAFITSMKKAQRIWVQFRDAEMLMMYPEREAGYYGSIHPVCWYTYLTELTTERIKKLKLWLRGDEEGNSCSPSLMLKQ